MKNISKSVKFLLLILFISNIAYGQWQINHQYGMKINVPSDWSKKSYQDGTDQVYEFYSADGLVAVTLRAFSADPALTMDMFVQVFEEAMLPAGTQKQLFEDHISFNGIPGKQAVYQTNQQGALVNIMCFYAIQNGNAYVLTGIAPNDVLQQKSTEIKSVTQSFKINGFERKQETNNAKVLPKPPGQNTGARPTAKSNNDSFYGRYNFVSRSDGKVLTNYHYIDITNYGTYEEKYEPINSPGYQGGNKGTWKTNMGRLYLRHEGGQITDEYMIKGNEIHRTSSNGLTFIFRKQ